MSEVTEAHGSTGGEAEGGPVSEDQYSGYLCGVCEEPLPYGAGTCIACGTPVAPLEDEEMVAGPYVFTGPVTGEVPVVASGDPYAPVDDEGAIDGDAAPADPAYAEAAAFAEPAPVDPGYAEPEPGHAEATAADPVYESTWAAPGEAPAEAPAAFGDAEAPTDEEAPPATATYAPDEHVGSNGSGVVTADPAEADLSASAPVEPPQPRRPVDDPAEAIGLERPTYPAPTVPDPVPDPMLGRAPTAPVLSPPPPLPATASPDAGAPPPTDDDGYRGEQPASSGPITQIVIGAVIVVLALLALGGWVVSHNNADTVTATPSTTTAAASPPPSAAPPPTSGASRAPRGAAADFSDITNKPADTDVFCTVAIQFRVVDPDPDSVAAKFLTNPDQITKAVVTLVHNAPADVKPTLQPLLETVQGVAIKVQSGEIKTVAQVRAASWPKFNEAVAPGILKHCQRYI
jgi:hypothetical protein